MRGLSCGAFALLVASPASAQITQVPGAETAALFLTHCGQPMLEAGAPNIDGLRTLHQQGGEAVSLTTYALGEEGARLQVLTSEGRSTCSLEVGWSQPGHTVFSGFTQFQDEAELVAYGSAIAEWVSLETPVETICPAFENLGDKDVVTRQMVMADGPTDGAYTYVLFSVAARDERQIFSVKTVARADRTLEELCRTANPPGGQ